MIVFLPGFRAEADARSAHKVRMLSASCPAVKGCRVLGIGHDFLLGYCVS